MGKEPLPKIEEEIENDLADESYDDYNYSPNLLELEDLELLEKGENGCTLRLLFVDGTWKDLNLPREVIDQLCE